MPPRIASNYWHVCLIFSNKVFEKYEFLYLFFISILKTAEKRQKGSQLYLKGIMMEKQIEYYENKLAYEIDASDLYDALENRESIVVVDSRQSHGYEKEHIPGSINLPHPEMTIESAQHLDKSKTYVCYCDGIGCNASTKGALKMAKLGFTVKELLGGIEWWKFDGYTTEKGNPFKSSNIKCSC